MKGITDGLDELVEELYEDPDTIGVARRLERLSDRVGTEHERRMEQQSREIRRAACRYFGGVIEDYGHGRKRRRNDLCRHTVVAEYDVVACPEWGGSVTVTVTRCDACDREFNRIGKAPRFCPGCGRRIVRHRP